MITKNLENERTGLDVLAEQMYVNAEPKFTWEFEDIQDYVKALRFFGYSEKEISRNLRHESGHIEKAKKFGFNNFYFVISVYEHPILARGISPGVVIEGLSKASKSERIQILENVDQMSYLDRLDRSFVNSEVLTC